MKKYNLLLLVLLIATSLSAQTKSDYNLLVHKKGGQPVTFDAATVDSISFMKMPAFNTGDDFKIELSEINSSTLNVTFTPKDEKLTYYASLVDQMGYDKAWDELGSLYTLDKQWWEYLASVYGKNWLEILPSQLSTGKYKLVGTEDYSFILWDHVYYAYCYGMDSDGEISTPYYIQQFRTPNPTPSANVITVESITPGEDQKIVVKVNASNGDQYYVGAQKKTYVDYYVQTLGSVDAMFKNLAQSMRPTPVFLHNGNKEIELYCNSANTDYVLIICGYDGGPTTPIQLIDFKSK
ncbi:MAG: hypothetical protein SOZ07_01270 [Prevotella sp.]|nr:hypothetical protein [Prevotella sp.]